MSTLLTAGNIHLALFENFWSMAHYGALGLLKIPKILKITIFSGSKKTTTSGENFLMK
jgi:hypothetical protein